MVTFNVTLAQLGDVTAAGDVVLHPGAHVIAATNGNLPQDAMPRWEVRVGVPASAAALVDGALLLKRLPTSAAQ